MTNLFHLAIENVSFFGENLFPYFHDRKEIKFKNINGSLLGNFGVREQFISAGEKSHKKSIEI